MTTETNLMGLTQSQNKTTIGRAKKKAGNGQVQQKALKIATMYLTKNSSLNNYIVATKQTLPKAQRTRGLSSSYQSNFLR